MQKILLLGVLALLSVASAAAQQSKKGLPRADRPMPPADSMHLKWRDKISVPEAESPFGLPAPDYKSLPPLRANRPATGSIRTIMGEQGLPIAFDGANKASVSLSESVSPSTAALNYWAAIEPAAIRDAEAEFVAERSHQDEQGNWHVRLSQQWKGIPVFGSEVIVHSAAGQFRSANARYYPTPDLNSAVPVTTALEAQEAVKTFAGAGKIKTSWSDEELKLITGHKPFQTELVVWHKNGDLFGAQLVWMVKAYRDVLHNAVYFVSATTGKVLDSYETTCKIAAHHHTASPVPSPVAATTASFGGKHLLNGAVTANGLDLLNQNRNFGAWDVNGTIILTDASQPMFKPAASVMPNEPVGAIVTLDAQNTTVEGNFRYKYVTSPSTTFSNKTAISAHYNAIRSYDYFRSKFNRNSIDGVGGTILSFINVAEEDGSSMENAFWNGEAMFYGNGGTAFRPLARGLDVGGHEMSHGVIQATANLIYQNQSGALNESFADIFAVLIDNDDWKIGEDVVQSGVSPNGCLRDMQNPNNGATPSSGWWQPKDMSEIYTGTEDNGGVHINSGITNRAFYLFASNPTVGRDKAEQVYYKALRDYLVKSSKFLDCRLAVVRAAGELYGTAVADVAGAAFEAVGITTGTTTNYLGNLSPNPGTDFILCTPVDYSRIDMANGNGVVLGTAYNRPVKSKPSMRDNGREFVFVNTDGHIIGGTLVYNGNNITPQFMELSEEPVWANAAISKDGRYVAALRDTSENLVFVFDLLIGNSRVFRLFNPTTSQNGTKSGDVRYADVLEFDYSGQYIMYDAYNEIIGTNGTINYWDIGFLQFRNKGQWADNTNPFISKLFSALPDRTSIGNPVFAKNSPYIVAFDFYDESVDEHDLLGANTETGDYDAIVENNGDWGVPNYNRLDNALIYQGPSNSNNYHIYSRALEANKIKGTGQEKQFIDNRIWGVWFANGTRNIVLSATGTDVLTEGLSAAPNPVAAQTHVRFKTAESLTAYCTLRDMTGRVLYQRTFDAKEGINQFDVDMEALPAGTYLLQVRTEKAQGYIKLIKL